MRAAADCASKRIRGRPESGPTLTHPIFSAQLKRYVFQAGQPQEVRRAYEEAMGLRTVAAVYDVFERP